MYHRRFNSRVLTLISLLVLASLLWGCGADATPTTVPPASTATPPAAVPPTTASAAPTDTTAPAAPTATTATATGGKVKIGLSFSDFATERWKNEEQAMRKLLE